MPLSHRALKDDINVELKQSHVVADGDSPNRRKGPKKRKSRAEKSCPEELKKYKMNYSHGRICWFFNLKDGCSLKTEQVDNKGYKCSKGFHVCAACQKPGHSALVCRSKACDVGQVGSGNTATEPAVANDEFAVSFTDGSPNGDHPMEVENRLCLQMMSHMQTRRINLQRRGVVLTIFIQRGVWFVERTFQRCQH